MASIFSLFGEIFIDNKKANEEIDKIIQDPEKPTFENTIAREDHEKGEHYYDGSLWRWKKLSGPGLGA